ncbi:MAG: tRNA epoxyqueuosine(34) reductase QueG [Acidobacteriota bacterium]|jgi:epoxyqueuosine reductase
MKGAMETGEHPEPRAELLKAWAAEAGFDRAGIARVGPSDQGRAFRAWIERGDHAGMAWIGRRLDRRLDPGRVLEGARSALCVALRYHPLRYPPGDRAEPEGDLWPRVARYARGADYHDLMGARLKALSERIRQAFPGTEARVYVDTGPVLERELAARAGIGVQGKNTNLLDREMGSWFLLGEILLTLDLSPDRPPGPPGAREPEAPVTDLCTRCTRCLDHCPTGALPEPYRLDANRCISYWTIEHRGDFPPEVREMVGDWVFGCDVCQEVCPWNVRGDVRGWERVADHPELRLPPERRELDLAGLLRLGRDEYVERFRGSPMKRAKLGGLKRNAAAAMGNRGDPGYCGPLAEALARDEDPVVRRQAAWSLGRLGTSAARDALHDALETESDRSVAGEIRAALGAAGGAGTRDARG